MSGLGRRAALTVLALLAVVAGTGAALGQGTAPVGPPTTPPSVTPPSPIGTVSMQQPVLDFAGQLQNPTPLPLVNNPVPVVCAAQCREFAFTDDAPGAPVLVGIKSTVTGPGGTFNADEGYDLYVYDPANRLVAGANGIGADGQAVTLTAPTRGRYTIVVTFTYAYDANAGYVGQVRLMSGPSWQPPAATCGLSVGGVTGCFELPALRVLPPYDLTTSGIPPAPSTPLGFPFPVSFPTPTSCYADETVGLDNTTVTNATNPVLRCLRFTSDIQNVGAGPLAAQIPLAAIGDKGQPEVGYLPGGCQARQVLLTPQGQAVTRPAGSCEFHVEHGHFHYDALLTYALFQAAPDGTPTGKVIGSSKASFCLSDDDYFGFGSGSINGPRENVGQPDCNIPRQLAAPTPGQNGSGTYIDEGITPGWGDVYTWDTPGQYIDVTHVPAGTYDLVEETNPDGSMLVAGPAQTCSMTELRLAVGPSSDTVQQVGSQASVTCPANV